MTTIKCFWYSAKISVLGIVISLIIALLCFLTYSNSNDGMAALYYEKSNSGVIIDPGHGGKDGGASSENGVLEKDLNLKISLALKDVLKLCDIKVAMTRETDSLVCDENDVNLKGKIKATDLKNRVDFSKEYPDFIFVSIHMNKFPVEKYKGLQVYYSANNKDSVSLANDIQDNVTALLQKNNNRKVKAAGNDIYILSRIKVPAVLVECGFLSNKEETALLCDFEYRSKLSVILADSIMTNLLN